MIGGGPFLPDQILNALRKIIRLSANVSSIFPTSVVENALLHLPQVSLLLTTLPPIADKNTCSSLGFKSSQSQKTHFKTREAVRFLQTIRHANPTITNIPIAEKAAVTLRLDDRRIFILHTVLTVTQSL